MNIFIAQKRQKKYTYKKNCKHRLQIMQFNVLFMLKNGEEKANGKNSFFILMESFNRLNQGKNPRKTFEEQFY